MRRLYPRATVARPAATPLTTADVKALRSAASPSLENARVIRQACAGVCLAMKSSIRRQASAEASACRSKVRSKNECGAPS